jgi:hypothetical protein
VYINQFQYTCVDLLVLVLYIFEYARIMDHIMFIAMFTMARRWKLS